MTLVRLGYVAMSVHLVNASPSHDELSDWQWIPAIRPQLAQLGQFAAEKR
ncbi:hypothetical protein GCM10010965_17810 [Caldalkalibacillus thermarum]|nr:hypothetical protein [Caldalkalibacillus thermarum]GGK25560.1 hypothetical protein GCM10010965_17810 [Caldalkalibacillus thermarum]